MTEKEFQEFTHGIRPQLTSLCQRFFKQTHLGIDAEDAVQETLVKLWKLQGRHQEYRNLQALAIVIAKNKESEMQKKYQNAIIVNSQNEQAAKDWYHKYINSQQKIQHPIYIIDGEKSVLFDGSQLEGKIIKNYTIDTDTTKAQKASINTIHRITTTTEQPIRLQGLKNASQNKKQETIYILNGKKVSKTEIEKFPQSNISNIVILKGGTKAATQYSTDPYDTSTYVVITTK